MDILKCGKEIFDTKGEIADARENQRKQRKSRKIKGDHDFLKFKTSYLPNFRASILLFTSYFLLLTSHLSYAGGMVYWTLNGVQLTTRDGGLEGLADDMKGGAITFSFAGDSVYAIRVDRNGNLPWALQGKTMDNYSGPQSQPIGVSDGRGGAIAVWYRGFPQKLYYQRVDSLGNRMWGANAQRVTLSDSAQWFPMVVSDNDKGMIVVWQEVRFSARGLDIYAQRIDSSGVRKWGDSGMAVCAMDSGQGSPIATSDNAGNCVIAWVDSRDGEDDIYAQRLNVDGQSLWLANGIPVCDTNGAQTFSWGGPLYGSQITMATDTTIIVTWIDQRNGNCDIYTQSLNLNGLPLWVSQGVAVCDTINSQGGGILIADCYGGAIFCWVDERNGFKNIYAQKLNSNGEKLWANQGVPITATDSAYWYQRIVTDGKSGAIICWQDKRSANWDIYAQHIDSLGSISWDINGMPVCTAVNHQQISYMVESDSSRAIIVWDDYRSTPSARGYAQKVGDDGVAITETGRRETRRQKVSLQCYPNPFSGWTYIKFQIPNDKCQTNDKGKISIKIYDVTGTSVKQWDYKTIAQSNQITWDGKDNEGKILPEGIYFCEFAANNQRVIKKLVSLK